MMIWWYEYAENKDRVCASAGSLLQPLSRLLSIILLIIFPRQDLFSAEIRRKRVQANPSPILFQQLIAPHAYLMPSLRLILMEYWRRKKFDKTVHQFRHVYQHNRQRGLTARNTAAYRTLASYTITRKPCYGRYNRAMRCRCKFRFVSNFTTASYVWFPYHSHSTAFLFVFVCRLRWIICQKVISTRKS